MSSFLTCSQGGDSIKGPSPSNPCTGPQSKLLRPPPTGPWIWSQDMLELVQLEPHHTAGDSQFAIGVGANPPWESANIQISQKLHEIKKMLVRRWGARREPSPPDPPLATTTFTLPPPPPSIFNFVHYGAQKSRQAGGWHSTEMLSSSRV